MINYGSVCSGIEAASVAWKPLGWQASWLAEIEPFPIAVLAHHYPQTPNLGDMTTLADKILSREIDAPDVFVGGTPCQAFSIAGLRNSLEDDRGQLTLEFVRIANAIDTRRTLDRRDQSIIVWENVPGVLNTKDNAFGNFLAALAGEDEALQPPGVKWTNAGYVSGPQRAVAWRVLDAQYFGVAQRRRRVFVVASARDDINPAEILFEFDGVRRDIAPSREARKEVTELAGTLAANAGGLTRPAGNCNELDFCVVDGQSENNIEFSTMSDPVGTLCARDSKGVGNQFFNEGKVIATRSQFPFNKQRIGEYSTEDVASTCAARDYKDATDLVVHPIHDKATRHQGGGSTRPGDGAGNGLGVGETTAPSYTLTSGDKHAVGVVHGTQDPCYSETTAFALGRNNGGENAIHQSQMQVRRLTPIECERLQGFPDNYTQIPWRKKTAEDCPDGPRYKALGNSMAVPVMAWIGQRIETAVNKTKV